MGNVYVVSPNDIQQLCFKKVLSWANILEDKFQPHPFLEHTGMTNINLASPNNIQQLFFPKIEPRPFAYGASALPLSYGTENKIKI